MIGGKEAKEKDRALYKLTTVSNPNIIQVLISIENKSDHVYIHVLESAYYNVGETKVYQGCCGNLVAFACKVSKEKGHKGFVAWVPKTRLIEHYKKTISATLIGGPRMIMEEGAAEILIQQYFKTK